MAKHSLSRAGSRSGAAAVEFALVVPIMLLFMFGIIEFSRMLILDATVDQIAYESCRVGIAIGATSSDVEAAVDSLLESNRIVGATSSITPVAINDSTDKVRVEISVPLAGNSWGGLLKSFFGTELVGSCELEHESELLRRQNG